MASRFACLGEGSDWLPEQSQACCEVVVGDDVVRIGADPFEVARTAPLLLSGYVGVIEILRSEPVRFGEPVPELVGLLRGRGRQGKFSPIGMGGRESRIG